MKKTLLKITTLVFFCLMTCICALYSFSNANFAQKMHQLTPMITLKKVDHLLALQNETNLKTYHYGLSYLTNNYRIPSQNDLLESIRNHACFISSFSDKACIQNLPFFLFETQIDQRSHFFCIHENGVRHFTIDNTPDFLLASIANGDPCYTSLEKFLQANIKNT